MSNSYAILLITRNGLEYTRRCLKSIVLEKPNVLLIDNSSTDGTQRYVRTLVDLTVATGHFQSLAACWNWGLTALFTRNDHVLVLNNDTELLPGTARSLMEEMEYLNDQSKHVGLLSGVSVRTLQEMIRPKLFTPPSPHPDFSCFMISRACFESVGHFDEAFLSAYCEDCDYHIRMHRKGWRAMSTNLPFLHHGSGTIRTSDDKTSEAIQIQAEANRQRLESKWGARPGTPEYDKLFTAELFGAEELTHS